MAAHQVAQHFAVCNGYTLRISETDSATDRESIPIVRSELKTIAVSCSQPLRSYASSISPTAASTCAILPRYRDVIAARSSGLSGW